MMEKLNVAASRAIVNWMVLPMHYKGFAIGEFTSHIYLAGFTGKLWVITDNKKVNAAVHEILTVCLPELVWLNPDIPKQWWEGRKGIEEARMKYKQLKHYVKEHYSTAMVAVMRSRLAGNMPKGTIGVTDKDYQKFLMGRTKAQMKVKKVIYIKSKYIF